MPLASAERGDVDYLLECRLPNELLVEIIKHLPVSDVLRYRTLNRASKELIDTSPVLRYMLVLHRAGVIPQQGDIHSALMQLQREELAWSTFKAENRQEISQSPSCMLAIVNRNILAEVEGQAVHFRQLPPVPQWDLPERWSIPVSITISRLYMYPEQDLLIATNPRGLEIHFLSLLSGRPHPLALKPMIALGTPNTYSMDPRNVQVADDFVGMMLAGESWEVSNKLLVFNWQTGTLWLETYHQISEANHPSIGATSFEFLDNCQILLPVIQAKDDSSGTPMLFVLDYSTPSSKPVPYQDAPRVATFLLPPLRRTAGCPLFFSVSDAPGPSRDPHSGLQYDPTFRLIAFQLAVYCSELEEPVDFRPDLDSDDSVESDDEDDDVDDDRARLYLFVHCGTLERHYREAARGAAIPWEVWAPGARLIRQPGDGSIWLFDCTSYRKCLIRERHPIHEHLLSLWLYDFPPPSSLTLRGVTTPISSNSNPWTCMLEPEVLDAKYLFSSPVVSGLPYRKVNTGYVQQSASFISQMNDQTHCYLTPECILGCKNKEPWIVQSFCT